jgi:hypothetical protein
MGRSKICKPREFTRVLPGLSTGAVSIIYLRQLRSNCNWRGPQIPDLIPGGNGKWCDIIKNDITDTCLGTMYLRMEQGVCRYFKFERKPVQEILYQLSDTSSHILIYLRQSACISAFLVFQHFSKKTLPECRCIHHSHSTNVCIQIL